MTGVTESLLRAVEEAAEHYYGLVILAGPPGSGKTAVLKAVAGRPGYVYLNLNLELSKRLLDVPRTQRPFQAERALRELVASTPTGGVALLDNVELLFEPSLDLVPLGLLKKLSRERRLVAAWPGEFRDDTLSYAVPGHPEEMGPAQPECIVVAARG
jgi:hypothetical protein